jgi:hypothetical protein
VPMPADTSSTCRSTHASGGLAIRVRMPQRTSDAGLSKTFRMADKKALSPIPARSTAPMSS